MDGSETVRVREEIQKLFPEMTFEVFKPFAAYNKRLDSIWVLTKDCSVTEVRISDMLTLLEDNYPEKEEEKYVGFVIAGARGFCLRFGLLSRLGEVDLPVMLDAFFTLFPHDVILVDSIVRRLLKQLSSDVVVVQ